LYKTRYLRYMRIWSILSLLLFGMSLWAQQDVYRDLQTRLQLVEDGGIVELPEGRYTLARGLWLDEKRQVTIRGAGPGKTVLDFKGQQEGAEGLRVTRSQGITLEGFTVLNTAGDAIKVQETEGITFYHVEVGWEGKPSRKNGGYGLYPVQCRDVLIDHCIAYGASDAGIYVGQSSDIIVRHCHAYHNVAGIEIENSHHALVHNNIAERNTGGILVFDLPELLVKSGSGTRVVDNIIRDNNLRNFAPKGNIVAQVPAGSGVILLAAADCEVIDNEISNHRTFGTAIISYYVTELPIQDTAYIPYPRGIHIENNQYIRSKKRWPSTQRKIGRLMAWKFRRQPPDIIHDGIWNPAWQNPDGSYPAHYQICIGENGVFRFANLDAANGFKDLSLDLQPYTCTHATVPAH
jgi:parallel beta-helix repeat protein